MKSLFGSNDMEVKICQVTTVHFRDDSRIRLKITASLHRRYKGLVTLYVQDGLGNSLDNDLGYPVIDTGPRMSRLKRIIVGGFLMFRRLLQDKANIVHFHDPEFIPWALLLRFMGVKIIYDIHEDYPEAVKHNFRLPAWARLAMPPLVRVIEFIASRFFDLLVTVTNDIADRFPSNRIVVVRNTPLLSEFNQSMGKSSSLDAIEFIYVGTLNRNRNIFGMIDVAKELKFDAKLVIAGDFTVEQERNEALNREGWDEIEFLGWLPRDALIPRMERASAGLLLILPVPHETVTLPIKLFEYMAAGLPVISSDFPLWRDIIVSAECGILVDPEDSVQILEAMRRIISDPIEAQRLGNNGRKFLEEDYNWSVDESILFDAYEKLINSMEK